MKNTISKSFDIMSQNVSIGFTMIKQRFEDYILSLVLKSDDYYQVAKQSEIKICCNRVCDIWTDVDIEEALIAEKITTLRRKAIIYLINREAK